MTFSRIPLASLALLRLILGKSSSSNRSFYPHQLQLETIPWQHEVLGLGPDFDVDLAVGFGFKLSFTRQCKRTGGE